MFIDHIKNTVPALRDRIRASRIDPKNRAAFGAAAPVHGQAIRVATTEVTTEVKGGPGRALSGVVLQGDWDIGQTPLTKNSKIAYCLQHWVEGKTWEESGAYELLQKLIAEKGSADNCRTHHDVVNRYARLDTIMEQVKSSGGLEPSSEMRPGSFRECGGILIHIDREGRPVFGGGGHHRLAIAMSLGLGDFPAQLGAVHPNGLDALARFAGDNNT